jgi:hypothetical protein
MLSMYVVCIAFSAAYIIMPDCCVVVGSGTKAEVDGLMIMDNTWANYNMPHNRTVVVDERNGTFHAPRDVVM